MKNRTMITVLLIAGDWANSADGGNTEIKDVMKHATDICKECGEDPVAEFSVAVKNTKYDREFNVQMKGKS